MRSLAVALVLVCCSEPPLPERPLPPLQTSPTRRSIAREAIAWSPGEAMSWSIRWRGIDIGVAELEVTGLARSTRVRSWFSPDGWAGQLRPVSHELITSIDPGDRLDDLHSALGRVRAWARAGAAPAELDVLHAGERYRVRLAPPVIERPLDSPPVLRIEGEARSLDGAIEMTLWLSTDRDRVPVSASVDVDGHTITARLLAYDRGR